MPSKLKNMKPCKISFFRISSLQENVWGQIKDAFKIIVTCIMSPFRHLDDVVGMA